jgi:hypothetical protein
MIIPVRDILVGDSRNWRNGAGALSMIGVRAESLKTLQAIGEKGRAPLAEKK